MKPILTLAAAAAALLALSCNPTGSGSYFPLALDNTWTWLSTTVTTWRGTIDTTITHTDSSTTQVAVETTLAGKPAWKLRMQGTGYTSYSYLVEDDDRVLNYSSPTDSMPATLLKLPLAENATWVVDSLDSYRIIATVKEKESVTVPAGRFSGAWRVEQKSDTTDAVPFDVWYAPGVGQVKTYMAFTNAFGGDTMSMTMSVELTHYDVE